MSAIIISREKVDNVVIEKVKREIIYLYVFSQAHNFQLFSIIFI